MTSDRLSKVFQCSKGNTYLCRRIYVHTVQILVYLNPTMYISSSKPLTNDVDIEQQLKSFCVWILFWAIVHILLLVLTSTLNSQLQCFDYSFQMTFNFALLGLPRLGSTWLSLDWLGFGQWQLTTLILWYLQNIHWKYLLWSFFPGTTLTHVVNVP